MTRRTRHLIEAQIPALRRFAFALTRERDAADDLVQDCLARALTRWHLLRSEDQLRAWLFRILRNLYHDAHRRRIRRPEGGALVHHSDRGPKYLSIKYTEKLGEAGSEPSVGSVGDSYYNALAETINGLFKAEVIHRRGPWPNFEAVEYVTLEWVDWFNNRRLLEPIWHIPPAEAEAIFYAALETADMAA